MPPSSRSTTLVLTRRGRLVRTIVVALAAVLVVTMGVLGIRALADGSPTTAEPPASTTASTPSGSAPSASDGGGDPSDAGGAGQASATPEADPELTEEEEPSEPGEGLRTTRSGIVRSDTAGDGTWTVAPVVAPAGEPAGTVHRYALRVENGTGIDPQAAAQEVAAILADERGWTAVQDVSFEQVADPEQADFTISLASPPTVDELCLPARTHGIWSCRIGPDVALNSDRWVHMTPTYSDVAEYRAYMVNHEVGHFLGLGHESCGGEGLAAPVMMQQSKGLQGCRANAWPTSDGQA